jgi:hypothetical protein
MSTINGDYLVMLRSGQMSGVVGQALKNYPDFEFRAALHQGLANRMKEASENPNLSYLADVVLKGYIEKLQAGEEFRCYGTLIPAFSGV